VRIDINRIPIEGLILTENFTPEALDLEIDIIKFRQPINARAVISKITNAVTVNLSLEGRMYAGCSRCLDEVVINLKKNVRLNYPADNQEPAIVLDPDIREEIVLDYPIKPLCRPDCKGLCPKCGKNLNEGGCSCGPT
jgi:uncharacterized protein